MSMRGVSGVFNIVPDLYSSILVIVIVAKWLVSSELQLHTFNQIRQKKKKKKQQKNCLSCLSMYSGQAVS